MKFVIHFQRVFSDLWANIRLRSIIDFLPEIKDKKILDLGCGFGYLGKYYLTYEDNDIFFADVDAEMLAKIKTSADRKFLVDISNPLPFPPKFDYVFCADVLEHLANDRTALINIFKVIKKGGQVIITLPAFSWLYGHHDRIAGHYRRYDIKPFIAKAKVVGFLPKEYRYTCSLLFLPFLLNQLFIKEDKVYTGCHHLVKQLAPFLNFFVYLESKIKLPFGIGLLIKLEK